MRLIEFLIITSGLALCSCGGQRSNNDASEKSLNEADAVSSTEVCITSPKAEKVIPKIDLCAYDKKNAVGVDVQSLGDVEYVVLELTDSSLISSSPITITESYIVTRNKEGSIIFFDRDGSFSHSFNHKGGAGFEYQSIGCMAVMPGTNDVFIGENSKDRIQQYDSVGNHIKTIKLPYRHSQRFSIYNDSTLLVHDLRFTANEQHRKKYGLNTRPLYLISIITGSVTELPFEYKNPILDGISYEVDNTAYSSTVYGYNLYVPRIVRRDYETIISEALMDTVYLLRDMAFSPLLIKENTISEAGSPILTTIDGLGGRYLLLYIQEKRIDMASNTVPDPMLLIYDYVDGSIKNAVLTNADGISKGDEQYYINRLSGAIHTVPSGYMAQLLETDYIIELRDRGKLSGELKKIADQMDDESNPLLMLLRLN